jgi:hypothetical protein
MLRRGGLADAASRSDLVSGNETSVNLLWLRSALFGYFFLVGVLEPSASLPTRTF